MEIKDKFLKLKQYTNSLTHNPLLDAFDQEDLATLEHMASTDLFIKEKTKKILHLIDKLQIDFDSKLKSAFDEYIEALTYLRLRAKFNNVYKVPEGDKKTPDFKIEFSYNVDGNDIDYTIYAELKSLSYADRDLNYKDAMEQGIKARIDIERQINVGRNVASGESEIQPLHKFNKKYNDTSTKYVIEVLIEKIDQNLKKEQFSMGDTVLFVDLKQLSFPGSYIEGGCPVYQEKQYNSFVSGIQWNVAFGKIGHLLYKPIEFEGKENIDDALERDGIFTNRDWIKAIIFFNYSLGEREPKIVGLHMQSDLKPSIEGFLYKFCDFINDDKNTNGWKLSNPV